MMPAQHPAPLQEPLIEEHTGWREPEQVLRAWRATCPAAATADEIAELLGGADPDDVLADFARARRPVEVPDGKSGDLGPAGRQ